jgi:DNA-binding SARP family transcriptional activator
VERHRLQERLFPDTDPRRGGNYFRQVVHKLRHATGVNLARSSQGHVRWPEELHVDSTDVRFERLLSGASRLQGRDRLDQLVATLALVEGPYLPESDLEWVEARRHELEVLIVEAAVDAAQVALALADFDRARWAATFAIGRDPYCEPAYCVRMRVEASRGSPNGVLAEYQRLTDALTELDVEPSRSTRTLVRELRGALPTPLVKFAARRQAGPGFCCAARFTGASTAVMRHSRSGSRRTGRAAGRARRR